MTNVLTLPTAIASSPSRINIPVLTGKSFVPNSKSSVTFVIQPPSLNTNQTNPLLAKRINSAELGDSLMKKIKSKAVKLEDNSSPISSNFQGTSSLSPQSFKNQDNVEANSMAEEISSNISSEDLEIPQVQKFSLTQKNVSSNSKLGSKSGARDSQDQIQQALGLLQKKIFFQQVASLTESLIKEQLAKTPVYIPPFMPMQADEPIKVQPEMFSFNENGEDKPKVIIGSLEYPLLSTAPQEATNQKVPTLMQLNYAKASNGFDRSLLESLCVTRAETQRSESDEGSCRVNEEVLQAGKRGRGTKAKVRAAEIKTQKRGRKQTQKKAKNNSNFSESSQSP